MSIRVNALLFPNVVIDRLDLKKENECGNINICIRINSNLKCMNGKIVGII